MPLIDPATGAKYLMPSDEIELAVAAERERCAKICEARAATIKDSAPENLLSRYEALACAATIRNKE